MRTHSQTTCMKNKNKEMLKGIISGLEQKLSILLFFDPENHEENDNLLDDEYPFSRIFDPEVQEVTLIEDSKVDWKIMSKLEIIINEEKLILQAVKPILDS